MRIFDDDMSDLIVRYRELVKAEAEQLGREAESRFSDYLRE